MKKSQSATNAAILITLISALIIIYVIFLPADERLEIIGENGSDRDRDDNDNVVEVLVEDQEIVMKHFKEGEIEYDLPSVNLFTKKGAERIAQANSIYVKNGVFENEDHQMSFSVADPRNTDNLLISFFAKKAKGRLSIRVNGHEIFNNVIDKVNSDPIHIPSDVIANTNDIVFSVSGVGAQVWATNEYLIENFQITADVTDTSTRGSELTFVVPQSESQNIEEARLRFVPECRESEVGILDIEVNGRQIFSAIPDCGTPRPIEFSPALIVTGENTVNFHSNDGRYLIDNVEIFTELEDTPSYTYFFEVDDELYEEVRDDEKDVNLTFFFVDDKEDKEAEIIINSRKTFMTRHDDFEWSARIDSFVEKGTNSLKIIPETRLEIRKLEVRVED